MTVATIFTSPLSKPIISLYSLWYLVFGSVSLSFDITNDSTQINHSKFDEFTKYEHQATSVEFKGYNWASDNYNISYHGFTVSHMDGLAHLAQDGKLYNGYDASKISPQGFEELGIEAFNEGIISKGVFSKSLNNNLKENKYKF